MSRPRRYDRAGFGAEETTVLRATIVVVALSLAGWSSALADRIEEARDLVRALASVGGVAGHEGQVRAAIRKVAPTWASFQDDNLGNLTRVGGSGKPPRLLLAHQARPAPAGLVAPTQPAPTLTRPP